MHFNSDIDFNLNKKYKNLEELNANFIRLGYKIDLGCGYYKPDGYIGFDNLVGIAAQEVDEKQGPDVFMDLNHTPFPLADNSCLEVRTSHFLEHSNVDHILIQSHRVLKSEGRFIVRVPYANSAEGMYPGHTIFFTEKWFYLNKVFNDRFSIVSESYQESDDWQDAPDNLKNLVPFEVARKFFFNCCNEMTLTCEPKK